MGRRVFRNYYKGHMDKTKGEGGSKGGRLSLIHISEPTRPSP